MSIPRLFHRVWLDDDDTDPIPDEFEFYWRRLKELHPGGKFVTWRKTADLWWMRNREPFEAATTHAGRSDVARYEIVARFGGVYLDTDVEPLQPFDELLVDDRPFAGWEDSRMICPTVIGGTADHPALQDLIDSLGEWERQFRGKPPNQATGPHFLTARWRYRDDVRLFDPIVFYPTHWSDKAHLGGPYGPETFAEHKWAAQWLPAGPPQR